MPGSMFEDRVLLGFVAAATVAMAWISWPFFGAILWALVVTIAFAPVHDRLAMMMPGGVDLHWKDLSHFIPMEAPDRLARLIGEQS